MNLYQIPMLKADFGLISSEACQILDFYKKHRDDSRSYPYRRASVTWNMKEHTPAVRYRQEALHLRALADSFDVLIIFQRSCQEL